MLYLFYGTDGERTQVKVHDVVAKLVAKRPDATVLGFDAESWDEARFEEMLGAETLFAGKSIVVGKRLLGDALAGAWISTHLASIADSENIFLLEEGELKKDIVTKIEKKAAKVQEISFAKSKAADKPEFNIYSLSDALGARDRRGLWIAYARALDADLVPEELYWKCVWQIKNMILASRGSLTPTPESLGMNPYVFKKALAAAKNFTVDELVALHREFLALHHEARRGNTDFAVGLERLILSI